MRTHCRVLSRSGTRTRRDIFAKVISQREKKKKKQMRLASCEKGRGCNARSTADTFTKVIVSRSHAALWCFVRSRAGLGDLMQSTRRRARRRVLDLDSCCRCASGQASRNADAYPSPARAALDTSRHSDAHLHQNDVKMRERWLNGLLTG